MRPWLLSRQLKQDWGLSKNVEFNVYKLYIFYQAGSAKDMKKISQWSDHIINHFWYCCEAASKETTSDGEALSKMKVICT